MLSSPAPRIEVRSLTTCAALNAQVKLQQLCLYQLVLGYNFREKEAKGDAQNFIGR